MKALNTIPQEEYAERLFKAMQRMTKRIYNRWQFEEESLARKADNQGDEEKALRHEFNAIALDWAAQAIIMTPTQIKERLKMNKPIK